MSYHQQPQGQFQNQQNTYSSPQTIPQQNPESINQTPILTMTQDPRFIIGTSYGVLLFNIILACCITSKPCFRITALYGILNFPFIAIHSIIFAFILFNKSGFRNGWYTPSTMKRPMLAPFSTKFRQWFAILFYVISLINLICSTSIYVPLMLDKERYPTDFSSAVWVAFFGYGTAIVNLYVLIYFCKMSSQFDIYHAYIKANPHVLNNINNTPFIPQQPINNNIVQNNYNNDTQQLVQPAQPPHGYNTGYNQSNTNYQPFADVENPAQIQTNYNQQSYSNLHLQQPQYSNLHPQQPQYSNLRPQQ